MQKVCPEDRASQLNAVEVLNDFQRKLTSTSVAIIEYTQDEALGATLIVHVAGQKVSEAAMVAGLTERLQAVIAELNPAVEPQRVEAVKTESAPAGESVPSEQKPSKRKS